MNEESFVVIVNDVEQQHCLWRSRLAVPAGWRRASREGSQSECLALMAKIGEELMRLHALIRGQ